MSINGGEVIAPDTVAHFIFWPVSGILSINDHMTHRDLTLCACVCWLRFGYVFVVWEVFLLLQTVNLS